MTQLKQVHNAIKYTQKLKERLDSYTKASDFMVEVIEICEQDHSRLPGAVIIDLGKISTNNSHAAICAHFYTQYRDIEVLVSYNVSEECRDVCLLAACFAYAEMLDLDL